MTDFLMPDWPAPTRVKALQTTRRGGVSAGAFASLNLGDHVGDAIEAVAANRARVQMAMDGVQPQWLQQVHGTTVVNIDAWPDPSRCPEADAAISRQPGRACAIMTADCLPVLLCDRAGTVVAAAHAGWRSLCHGVLEKTVQQMGVDPADLLAWLGPAIGPQAFVVGPEVRAAFMAQAAEAEQAFAVAPEVGKWLGDLFLLARQRLAKIGVRQVTGGGVCTFSQPAQYFSFRRDGQTGRMATLIWLT